MCPFNPLAFDVFDIVDPVYPSNSFTVTRPLCPCHVFGVVDHSNDLDVFGLVTVVDLFYPFEVLNFILAT